MMFFRRFLASIHSWKFTLILKGIATMSQALTDLTTAIDGLIAKETAAVVAITERDKALADLAAVQAELAATNDALVALTAKVSAAP